MCSVLGFGSLVTAGFAGQMGELEIRELRARAEDASKEEFDLRESQDVILLNGPVPLPVLEDLVEDYIRDGDGQ